MIIFFALAVIIALLALAVFFRPLWRLSPPWQRRDSSAADVEQQAEWQALWATLAAQRTELEADAGAAMLAPDARDESVREWAGRADALLAAVQAEPAQSPAPLRRAAMASAAGVLIAAFALYGWLGNPAAIAPDAAAVSATPVAANTASAHAESPEAMQGMVKSLEARLASQPDNVSGWALLARSRGQLGDFAAASDAYAHALKLAPDDPDLLVDAADVLGMVQGRNLQGRPAEMIAAALALDPQHRKGLALAASAAMQRGHKDEAITFWQRLRATFAEGSDDAAAIDQVLAQLGAAGGVTGSAAGISNAFADIATDEPAFAAAHALPENQAGAKAAASNAATKNSRLAGVVELAPALAGKIPAGSTLFIYARAAATAGTAARMPLAVIRMPVPAFPLRFVLDDSMAMAPGMNLSGAGLVDVEARISASGEATPQPGDLRGRVAAVRPGSGNVHVVIAAVQP
ncbi:MAG: c-type cytochrome biogenesis protein CcmI [bacterium]|nr:c-type cytochrome biogenesis protein CcmI [bacterium]